MAGQEHHGHRLSGTHGRPPSGRQPEYSKHPNEWPPSSLLCSIDNPGCAGFITERYLHRTQSSNPFIQNYYWLTLCRTKAKLELWEISSMSRSHLSSTLFKHLASVSLKLFRRKSLTNALGQQPWLTIQTLLENRT